MCVRLTIPGDKGVRFSSFLYCSKVKNCRGKIRINQLSESHRVFINRHLFTHSHPLLKTLPRKEELGGILFQLNSYMATNSAEGPLSKKKRRLVH